MKNTLRISVLLNVMFLGGMLLLWWHPHVVNVAAPATPVISTKVEPQTAPVPVVQTVATPFRWSQFLSTNGYCAFVANLRAAGCPERTVEDIVRGDTGRGYAMMRGRLGVSATEPGRWSEQAQAQMVAYFLGQSPNAVEAQAVAETPAATGQHNRAASDPQTTTATLAAFLQNVDLTTPGMSTEQAQETANLRQAYLAQISAASENQNNQAGTPSMSGSEESILGGLFGANAAMQYEQYQAAAGGRK
jgi:hypothetical protein